MEVVYDVTNILQRCTLHAFSDYKSNRHRKMFPPMGPLIVVSNHLSNLDPSFLAASVSQAIEVFGKGQSSSGPSDLWAGGTYAITELSRLIASVWTPERSDGHCASFSRTPHW